MPMVSKITSAFRTWIGSDGSPSGSGPRKRSWESNDKQHVEQDILETPQAKRSKHSHEEVTSPIGKVANWIKKKASAFGDNYFYRPVDMQNGYDNHTAAVTLANNPVNNSPGQELKRRPLHLNPKVTSSREPVREVTPQKERRKYANGQDYKKDSTLSSKDCEDGRTSMATHQQTTASNISVSCRPKNQPRQVARKMLSTRPNNGRRQKGPLPTLSSTAATQAIGNSHTSVNQKLFARPSIRKSSASSDGGRNQSAASECVRLDQLQNYQHLLQQFTTANVSPFAMNSTLVVKDSMQESMTRHSTQRRKQESTELGSVLTRPKVTEEKTFHRTRVLPHEYNSRQEIREAARMRLHAPVSNLSPSATPFTSRHVVSTPAQPDFTRSESPIIVAVKPAPPRSTSRDLSQLTSFERSLTASPYALQDWVKDLKDRFESSVRIQHKNIERERATVNVYKHQRDEQNAQISQKITEDMKMAERRAAVIEEPPTPEISEDEVESSEESSEEEDEDLPEMTMEMNNEVNNALRGQPTNEVLTDGFRLRLTRKDMATLHGLNWLNDEIINFYMNLLVERSEQNNMLNLHCFNTFFYPKLLKEGQTGLRRWTKKTDIFGKDMILIPIHLGVHWCMAIIDFRKKGITYFDSMGGHNQKCLDALRIYLEDEHRDKKGSDYDMTGWSYSCPKDIPQQMNGSDCGMFACKFADYVSRDKRISFTQHDMPYFRKLMVWELLHKKLL